MDLAALLQQAIAANREQINAAQRSYPDVPIQVVFDWHPGTQKVDVVIRPAIRTPSFRAA